jgi:hypothetical protein
MLKWLTPPSGGQLVTDVVTHDHYALVGRLHLRYQYVCPPGWGPIR